MSVLSATLLVVGFTTAYAAGNTTSWIATEDVDWSTAAAWSDGEPQAGTIAEVGTDGGAFVSLAGETCAELRIGIADDTATVTVTGGSLNVIGDVAAGHSWAGSLNCAAGVVTIGGDLRVTLFGAATFGTSATASTVSVSGTLDVGGVLVMTESGNSVTSGTLSLASSATTQIIFLFGNGDPRFDVVGNASLGGALVVSDPVGIPDGSYEIIRAQTVTGSFDSAIFPPGTWSWTTDGASVYVIKGTPLPSQTTTWSGVKSAYRND